MIAILNSNNKIKIQYLTIKIETRTSRKAALKEDTKNVLEELWGLEEEEPLYKIFTREFLRAKSIQEMLKYSKEELKDLSYRDDDDTILYLQKHDVGKYA